ncbi:uncharacterized protein [Tursiops truncatus]|uniref:uncharacterized protein n=1 Tax=Tursiops truncatus TaxID=9739 RepID=UPI003CCF2684
MDFNLHCPCFHKGSLVTVPGVPWFKDPALRSQETSLQSSNGREAESNDVTRGESAGGLPTSPARFIEPSTGKTPAPHPPRRSGTLEIAGLDASLASSSPRGGGGEVDNLAASTTSDQRSGTPGARDAKAPDDRPIPPAGAGAPATLPARRPPVPGSRDPGRSRSALPARTVPSRRLLTGRPEPQRPRPAGLNRRLTPHGASQQPLRGYGHEPETPHAGPQEAPGPLGSRPLSGGPNRHRRRRTYQGRESDREHLTSLTLFRERTSTLELEGTASPHPPVRPATAHAHADPAPTRAREPARGARWEREFSRRCRRGAAAVASALRRGGR